MSMLMTIDAGNTNTVFSLYPMQFNADDAPIACWRCKTDPTRTADELAAWFFSLCQNASIAHGDVGDVIISSVVPSGNRWLSGFCQDYLGHTPIYVDHNNIGMTIALDRPQQAGADLLVNAYGVAQLYATPAIIIDFGTATTFTALADDHVYRGGVITPGINLSLDALQNAAARLPKIDLAVPETVIGADTVAAMQSGLYWGYVGMIEGLVQRMSDEMLSQQGDRAAQPNVIATGGLAGWFCEATDSIHQTDPDLTQKGLRLVYQALKA